MNNHTIKCMNPHCPGGRIETTFQGDDGYSNWTVLEDGFIEIKCHGCGKFGSTDDEKKPNELSNFKITCNVCGSNDWDYEIQDVDGEQGETHISCKECGAITDEYVQDK